MIEAGRLSRKITLQSPGTAQDAYGARTGADWVDEATVFAEIVPVSAREIQLAKGFAATVSHRITIRYRTGVKSNWRVQLGARSFSINGIIDPDERHENTVLFCTEVL